MHEQQLSELWMVKVQGIAKLVITNGDLLNNVHEACLSVVVAGSCNSKSRETLVECREAHNSPANSMF